MRLTDNGLHQNFPMARHNRFRIQAGHARQSLNPLGRVAVKGVRHRMVQEISRDQNLFFGKIKHRIAGCVAAPEIPDLHLTAPEVDAHLMVEHQRLPLIREMYRLLHGAADESQFLCGRGFLRSGCRLAIGGLAGSDDFLQPSLGRYRLLSRQRNVLLFTKSE
jgi:hypothetical protein